MLYFLRPALISQQGVTGSRGKRGVGTSWLMVYSPHAALNSIKPRPFQSNILHRKGSAWVFGGCECLLGTVWRVEHTDVPCRVLHTQASLPGSWAYYSREMHLSVMEKQWVTLRYQCQETITQSKCIYCTWLCGYGSWGKKIIWGWQMHS